MLIGLTGKAGAGKDTAALYLKQQHGYRQLAFATPIKNSLETMFGVDIETIEAMYSKDDIIPAIGTSLRKLYQSLGTDWGRQMIDENIWVHRMHCKMQEMPGKNVVISDVRFDNEADYIRKNGGTIIRLFRSDAKSTRAHPSESGIKHHSTDHLITNSGSLAKLFDQIRGTLNVIENDNHAHIARQAS